MEVMFCNMFIPISLKVVNVGTGRQEAKAREHKTLPVPLINQDGPRPLICLNDLPDEIRSGFERRTNARECFVFSGAVSFEVMSEAPGGDYGNDPVWGVTRHGGEAIVIHGAQKQVRLSTLH